MCIRDRAIYVRLRGEGVEGESRVNFQVHGYSYEAAMMERCPEGRGRTDFVETLQQEKGLAAKCESLGEPLPGGDHNTQWRLHNDTERLVRAQATLELWRGGKLVSKSSKGVKLLGDHAETIELDYDLRDAGEFELRFIERDLQRKQDVFVARVALSVPRLFAADYGWRLSDPEADVGVWWCESARKISRSRPLPAERGGRIRISAARNERESFQLVVHPQKAMTNVCVSVTDLRGPGGARIPSQNIAVSRVGYVRVESPTDATGVAG
ncbi:MAG: hypothetical protein N2689_18490, partial [Verrucomicrobiae bacterium]|nr:hypothetical protein [Verrucomicrobiae bacterium]